MGAVLFSLPAALLGSVYYTKTLGLGYLEAFSLYVGLGLIVMAGFTMLNIAAVVVAKVYNGEALRAR